MAESFLRPGEIGKQYGSVRVVEALSLDVCAGEIFAHLRARQRPIV